MKHFKLTVGSMFRLAAIAAIALSATRWIPRWSTTHDGNTSYYTLQFDGRRSYYALRGNEFGFRFEAKVTKVPGYAELKSYYANGSLRKHVHVYVERQTDGLKVVHDRVESGTFYLPDGSICSSIENGTGVVTETRAGGAILGTVTFDKGRIVGRKSWYRSGTLAHEERIDGLTLEVTKYFPEGMPSQQWKSENGRIIEKKMFDRQGNQVTQPVPFSTTGLF